MAVSFSKATGLLRPNPGPGAKRLTGVGTMGIRRIFQDSYHRGSHYCVLGTAGLSPRQRLSGCSCSKEGVQCAHFCQSRLTCPHSFPINTLTSTVVPVNFLFENFRYTCLIVSIGLFQYWQPLEVTLYCNSATHGLEL